MYLCVCIYAYYVYIYFIISSPVCLLGAWGHQPRPSTEYTYLFVAIFPNSLYKSIIKSKCSYIAQYPVLLNAQSALHFTSLEDPFNQILCELLWEVSSHAAINVYSSHSWVSWSNVEWKTYSRYHMMAQYLNLGSLSRESKALPLNHCTLQ